MVLVEFDLLIVFIQFNKGKWRIRGESRSLVQPLINESYQYRLNESYGHQLHLIDLIALLLNNFTSNSDTPTKTSHHKGS